MRVHREINFKKVNNKCIVHTSMCKIGDFCLNSFLFHIIHKYNIQMMEGGKTKVREGVDFYQYLLSIGDEVYDIIIKIIMMI